MFRLLIDHNLDQRIVRGLRLRLPDLDVVLARDVDLAGAKDPDVLEWAAADSRVTLSHDFRTLPKFAYDRITGGKRMPGVIVVLTSVSIGAAIEELTLIFTCCREDELDGQVYTVPL